MVHLKRLIGILCAAAVSTGSTVAFAADDLDSRGFSWSGFYYGSHLGGVWGESATTGLTDGAFDQTVGNGYTIDTDTDGWSYGSQLGYNVQRGSLVVGLEIDLGKLAAYGRKIGNPSAPSSLTDTAIEVDYGYYGVAAVRLGYVTGPALFYLKGGLAVAQITTKAGDLDSGNTVYDVSDTTQFKETYYGFAIGGGAEYALDAKWSLKAEYLFMDFGDEKSFDPQNHEYSSNHELHTIKFGVNYRF